MRNRRTSPCTTGSTPARPLTLAVVLALPFAGSITAPVLGDVKNWNTDSGAWGTDANWSPTGAPGPGSQVFLGNTLAAVNGTALLNVDATIASLVITDGMSLNTTNFNLLVNGPVTIAGANATRSQLFPSRLWVANGPSLIDVTTGAISLSDGAILQGDGGVLLANGVITVGDTAQVSGTGGLVLNANTSPALIVDGGLSASVGELVIAQNGTGRIDLDGTIAGDHTLLVAVVMTDGSDFSRLRIEGSGLTDAMDDDIQLGPGCELTMHLGGVAVVCRAQHRCSERIVIRAAEGDARVGQIGVDVEISVARLSRAAARRRHTRADQRDHEGAGRFGGGARRRCDHLRHGYRPDVLPGADTHGRGQPDPEMIQIADPFEAVQQDVCAQGRNDCGIWLKADDLRGREEQSDIERVVADVGADVEHGVAGAREVRELAAGLGGDAVVDDPLDEVADVELELELAPDDILTHVTVNVPEVA